MKENYKSPLVINQVSQINYLFSQPIKMLLLVITFNESPYRILNER